MSDAGLTVLITNLILSGRSGTENVVRNLAPALRALGHRPIVYSPRLGPIAGELLASGVPVLSDLHDAPSRIDIIHGHHLPTTVAAMARWPETPAIFVCHDHVAWHDRAPRFPAVRRFVGVDDTVATRLHGEGVPATRISVVLNQPDLLRFVPGPPLPLRARRALAFAKNRGHLEAIRQACAARGIDLEVAGHAVDRVLPDPERALREVDLVFTSALSALEAMACGRGVIVCDGRGLAGWASPLHYDEWRRRNFGLATLRAPVTFDAVLEAVDRYSAVEAALVAGRVRSEGGVATQAREYSTLYAAAVADDSWRGDPEETRRALAAHVQEWALGESQPRAWLEQGPPLTPDASLVPMPCVPGVDYTFTDPQTDGWVRPLNGVAPFDGFSRCTDGTSALLALRVPSAGPWELRLRVVPFLCEAHQRQRLTIEVNGLELTALAFHARRSEPEVVAVTIPADRIPDDGLLWVRLLLPDAVTPISLGFSEDPRMLAVALVDARLTPCE